MHTSQDALEPRYRNQVEFRNKKGLDHADGLSGNVRKTEIVVWILVVVLAVATDTAFRVLWIKAGGPEDRIRSVETRQTINKLRWM